MIRLYLTFLGLPCRRRPSLGSNKGDLHLAQLESLPFFVVSIRVHTSYISNFIRSFKFAYRSSIAFV